MRGTWCLARGEIGASAALAAALALLLVVALPRGDTAAHLHRTLLVEDGAVVWDLSWYAGHYPLTAYSVLYHPLAAVVGNLTVAVAAAIASAALFASIACREWGRAGRWPALAFALVAPAPVVLGQWPYAAGLAAALAALRLLQASRTWGVLAASAATIAFSPLAFVFLVVVLATAAVVRPAPRRTRLGLVAGLAALACAQVVVAAAFRLDQDFEFPARQLAVALAAVVPVAALALRRSRRDPLAAILVAWSVAIVVAFVAPLPLGENVTRPRWLLFPLALAAASSAGFRPRWLAATALVGVSLQRRPLRGVRARRTVLARARGGVLGAAARVPRARRVARLPRRGRPHRVPLGSALPPALGARARARLVPPARPGRQRAPLRGGPRSARLPRLASREGGPLRRAPSLSSRPARAEPEARLLTSGRSGLAEVMRAPDWTIYELPAATPLLTGPGEPRLTLHEADRIGGTAARPGTHRLRVRHTPYWRVVEGDVCVRRSAEGDTLLAVAPPGRFLLAAETGPRDLVAGALGHGQATC